ncbi:MAG: hypothetical protein QOG63_2173, partial [Thermoleophilaceae bacterium]|nr:hypothetical protein [Thermoleophilaceae bacterium]
PEFKSRPLRPQPLFRDFVAASLVHGGDREPDVEPTVTRTGGAAEAAIRES